MAEGGDGSNRHQLYEPREEAPIWLVDAIQNHPSKLRAALAHDPQLLEHYFFGIIRDHYVVELSYCALIGSHAAEALDILLLHGPSHWRNQSSYEALLVGIVSASDTTGLHCPEARPLVTRICRQCAPVLRDRMLELAIDMRRHSVAYAMVRAGATVPCVGVDNPELCAQLVEYHKDLAKQRTALVVLIGLRRFRPRHPWFFGCPLVLVQRMARIAWCMVD